VAAIIEHDSQILLTRRAHEPQIEMLDLPGGFVDYNEDAETALQREVYEELNLKIDNISYFTSAPNIYIYKDVSYYILDICFTCRPCNINDIKPKDDVSKLEFFTPGQIPINDLAFKSTKTGIKRYIASRRMAP
jgi:ADP-ribose pyrophosphatase YjhB (NUDIX family)